MTAGGLRNLRILRLLFSIVFFMIIFICASYSNTSMWGPQLVIPMKLSWNMTRTVLPIMELNNTGEFGLSQQLLRSQSLNITEQQLNKNTDETQISSSSQSIETSNPFTEANQLYETGHQNIDLDIAHVCPLNGLTTILLILISSALSHERQRMAIRQTWGHYAARRDIGIAFVLGRSINDTENKALRWENYLYGDLIRGNFIDSYDNLTLKTISSLEWADKHCNRAKYILKTDDDMFINVPKLFNFVEEQLKHNVKKTIFGRLAKKWPPVRNKKSKYYVSHGQFRGLYPEFTTGPAYLITGDIVNDLYVRALKMVYLKLEDVFITGIVAKSLNIKRVHVNEFKNRRMKLTTRNIQNSFSIHRISCSEQFEVWQKQHEK
ncbi:beta-1,3-galactosyltransferase 5-like [Drosophila albomicans]|uniref:Hexosyltransferase n=1 Tax=Drosophila albomicans TaxID=7291 RepID=A0A6P8W4Y9_DROAB|nr:beta-1,3-galactosyltransferase 5-like [Drosophila albomicans]